VWSLGIVMLTVALLMSAGLGIIQEWTYKKFGSRTAENMFYSARAAAVARPLLLLSPFYSAAMNR
jgi:hypothetical protein